MDKFGIRKVHNSTGLPNETRWALILINVDHLRKANTSFGTGLTVNVASDDARLIPAVRNEGKRLKPPIL